MKTVECSIHGTSEATSGDGYADICVRCRGAIVQKFVEELSAGGSFFGRKRPTSADIIQVEPLPGGGVPFFLECPPEEKAVSPQKRPYCDLHGSTGYDDKCSTCRDIRTWVEHGRY